MEAQGRCFSQRGSPRCCTRCHSIHRRPTCQGTWDVAEQHELAKTAQRAQKQVKANALPWRAVWHRPRQEDLLAAGVRVEVFRPDLVAEHHIVVEVNELVGQTGCQHSR